MGLFGTPHKQGGEEGGQTVPLPKNSYIYPTMMELGSYTLPKEIKKIYKSHDIPL